MTILCLQNHLDHMQVLGVPHMALSSGIHPNQLQQLGYDTSMMQVCDSFRLISFYIPITPLLLFLKAASRLQKQEH